MQFSSKQIKHLRSLAHSIKPVVMIGQHGLSDNIHMEIDDALRAHELIKIKLGAYEADKRKEVASFLCDHHHATHVQTIGKMLVMFKRNSKKPKIDIPKMLK